MNDYNKSQFNLAVLEDNPYQDILQLPHPVSTSHPQMSLGDRAAQFSPFAALTGFEGAIKETARLTDQRIELDETEKAILDNKLQILQEQMNHNYNLSTEIQVVYFSPDEMKTGGSYVTHKGVLKKIDRYSQEIFFQDGKKISIQEIIEITGEVFQKTEEFWEG